MFEINATLPIFVVSFLIFLFLLNKIMLEPIGRVLELRDAKIKADIEAGKGSRIQAEEILNRYQEHLHAIRHKAQGVINEATEKASYHRNLELGRIRDDGQQKLDEARALIASQREEAMQGLVEQETELVRDITHKLLGESVLVTLDRDQVRRALEEAS